jgi:hypothetical protein
VTVRIHGSAPVQLIRHHDHGVRIWREAAGDEECSHVLDIVDAAFQLVLGTDVVDSYEEGFAAAHFSIVDTSFDLGGDACNELEEVIADR